jgi:hypothetical protein
MSFEITRQSPGRQFGAVLGLKGGGDAHAIIEAAEKSPNFLPKTLGECEGLMVLKGMNAISGDPQLLVRPGGRGLPPHADARGGDPHRNARDHAGAERAAH